MKKKSPSQSAPARRSPGEGGFFNLRVLLVPVVLFAGVLLAVLAKANPQALARELAQHLDSQVRSASVPFASPDAAQEAWVARYNGSSNDDARAIAVDGSGNVYVTGQSLRSGPDNFDYATVKYNSAGQQLWVARYNGPGNGFDSPTAIAVDSSGNVYVTGGSPSSGTDPFHDDYATIKYNSAGQQQWVARYNGPANDYDSPTAMAIDSSGNVYVTGVSGNSNTLALDYVTIKYNSAGQQQWLVRYNGTGNLDDYAVGIAVDNSGNVYVTGHSLGTGGFFDYDYATVKYNSAGQQQWAARYDGPAHDSETADAIAIDGSGNVYVTGESPGSGTGYDYATIKYNAAGQALWIARYNGPGNLNDGGHDIAVDNSGNVYVTGGSNSSIGLDYATIKYNAAGQALWVARYNGPANGWDRAAAIALDSSGNVYVTGHSLGSGTGYDYATVKYDASGQEAWVARYNGPGNGADYAHALAVDNSGNVYVTGVSLGSGTDFDYATIKYAQGGTPPPAPTDFNNDGKPDLVLYKASTQQTAVWYLDNNVYIGGAYTPTLPAGWIVVSAADFNRDGHPDYALFKPSTRQTVIWYFSGVTRIGSAYGPTPPSGWALVATGDFNNNGKPDYVLYNASTHRTAVWFLDNNVYVGGAYGPTLPAGWSVVGVADFNRDGKSDYLLFNPSTRQTAIFYLSGTTWIGTAAGPTPPAGWSVVGVADFNRDGKPDYLLFNANTRQTVIWYMDNNVRIGGAYGPTLPAGWTVAAP